LSARVGKGLAVPSVCTERLVSVLDWPGAGGAVPRAFWHVRARAFMAGVAA
jgi:hypothetical protein